MCVNLICKNVFPYLLSYNKFLISNSKCISIKRNFVLNGIRQCNRSKELITVDCFEAINNKNKETYLDMVKIFEGRDVRRRGHVEFIYSALRHMDEFGVHKDLEVYKSLVDILPKGKFIPTNIFQAEFMHYPKQQQCVIDILQQMEDNGVIPDLEMEDLLVNIFGRRGYPLRKYWRMMYWMPKFKNLSPWPLPNTLPSDSLELAKLAISRIASIDLHSQVTIYQCSDIDDSIDHTWIVSAQSPIQRNLLENHASDKPIYVEGAFRIWIRNISVNYFILRTDADTSNPESGGMTEDEDDVSKINIRSIFNMSQSDTTLAQAKQRKSVHEQEDGTILAVCATGTSSKDSLLSWIRHLEKNDNPTLDKKIILFRLTAARSSQDQDDESITETLHSGLEEKTQQIPDK